MIPLRDINPTRNKAWITPLLIAINVLVFVFAEWLAGPLAMSNTIERYGIVPWLLLHRAMDGAWVTLLSSMFLHGGWMHLIGNMWFLHIFGDNVEDALGRARFLLFFLACGLCASLTQVLLDPASHIPMVGASGAIAGVLAAYLRLYPRARVVTLVPIFILLHVTTLPAFLFIFVWFGYQLLMALGSLGGPGTGGVAFFAHVGGFAAGFMLIPLMLPKSRPRATGRHHRVTHVPNSHRWYERWKARSQHGAHH